MCRLLGDEVNQCIIGCWLQLHELGNALHAAPMLAEQLVVEQKQHLFVVARLPPVAQIS